MFIFTYVTRDAAYFYMNINNHTMRIKEPLLLHTACRVGMAGEGRSHKVQRSKVKVRSTSWHHRLRYNTDDVRMTAETIHTLSVAMHISSFNLC